MNFKFKLNIYDIIFFILINIFLIFYSFSATSSETIAKYALLIDADTDYVMLEKNSNQLMYPASMSKLMTSYIVFDRLKSKTISLDDTFRVSEKAWKKGGSKMFVEVGSRVTVEDLLRGMIVQSGNDASIVLAEGLSGSEEMFALEMNRYAKKMGLNGSNFKNSTGWPDPEHITTANDLGILAKRLFKDFPFYMKYYSEKTFTYNNISQGNRNPLLYKNLGADGLKTGHTEKSGYGLVASTKRGNRRLILVINGLESSKQRSIEAERLLDWGYREFDNYSIFKKNQIIKELPVWLGQKNKLPIQIKNDIKLTMTRPQFNKLEASIIYNKPIHAPINSGQQVAILKIKVPNESEKIIPLLSNQKVSKINFFGRIKEQLLFLLYGHLTNEK
ncbi:D-alanyl-D-alanine carboxypeptidase [Alphaproteobacteria bacterium]|nr:D-alanyl-D-alanine carboxypeptidase [Alphaproteobacteria bacterium]